MKRFHFQLESALAFRQQRYEAEQARMETLHLERRQLIQISQEAQRRLVEAQNLVVHSKTIDPSDLIALDSFHRATEEKKYRISMQVRELDERILKQRLVLMDATRELRLLEKLKKRRKAEWSAALDRETENDASDFYLAKWGRHPH
ncbi:MAG: hypothetical protein HY820_26610 [Acidobacteria bacterium]|nr:hypothetical protein [Acidobacteriota bacterium]